MALTNRLHKFMGLDPTGDLGGITFYTTKLGKVVAYDKAPPLRPPTTRQIVRRNRWRRAAELWQQLTQQQRDTWHAAARRARLTIHGYNLFLFFITTQKWNYADAITRASGIDLRSI